MVIKKLEMFVVILFLVILFMGFSSASFEKGNLSHSIEKTYSPGNFIKGWMNISLINEPVNSTFKDSFGNEISLINLINTEINKNFESSCSIGNCISDYLANDGRGTKTFDLNSGESKIIGFKFDENIESINSVSFKIESTALSSCYNQLGIDFFNDGEINIKNNKSSGDSCFSLKGCFDNSKITEDYSLGVFPKKHCQRIRLTESPGFKIGAWIREEDAGNKELTMDLYDLEGTQIISCLLLEKPSSEKSKISCDIDYLVKESKDYYVCIYSNTGTGNYAIKGYYDLSNGCGFYGEGIQPETAAFEIFAEAKRFDVIENLEISNSLDSGNTLSGEVNEYLLRKYGSRDCSINECIIPIKFKSSIDQTMILKDLIISYETSLGSTTETNFYNLSETPAKVSADFQKLYLDEGGFSLPSDYGDFIFELKLNNEEIFSEEIVIERVPMIKSLNPLTTASAFPTIFKVIVDSSWNITKYEWDFGDNNTKTTTTNKATHKYNSTGQYGLRINITDSNQKSSYKIFDVIVRSPKEEINKSLKKKLEDLTNIKTQIEGFPIFYQEELNLILDTGVAEEKLKQIQIDYKSASSEAEYNKIMGDLLNLEIPESIIISKSADLISFYPDKNNINLDVLQAIGGGSYDNEEGYKNSILSWNQENMLAKITFKEFLAQYEYFEKPALKIFELKINEKKDLTYNSYLIIRELDDLKFKENYLEKKESGYVYIDLKESEKTIVFSTTEDISFADLPAFISPELNRLVITKTVKDGEAEEKGEKMALFILILSLLVIIGFVTYIILQTWYKKKYENHLFKNRNNLYNMITYVNNAKKQGLKNKEISIKLKKAGWGYEQIRYVMRKYGGKRTGMFEIPVEKILKNFKKKDVQKNPYSKNHRNNQRF